MEEFIVARECQSFSEEIGVSSTASSNTNTNN